MSPVRSLGADVRLAARGWRWGARPPLPASALAHLPVLVPREFPTGWARRPTARVAREVVQIGGLAPLVRAEVTLTVAGRAHLDALDPESPVVLVSNHASHLDTAALISSLPTARRRRLVVAAAADYFFDAWWRAAGTALAFGTVPIERRGGAPSATPVALLRQGWSVLVFPEGTRSPDGALQQFKTGAARLALDAGVPLLPVAVRGSYRAMPRGRSWPVPGRPAVCIRYGAPLRSTAGEDPHALTARARAEVARLLDEDATTWWASLRRAAEPTVTPGPARWRRVWAATAVPERPTRSRAWR